MKFGFSAIADELEFQIPFGLAVFFTGELRDLLNGKLGQWQSGAPNLAQSIFDEFRWNLEIQQEVGVGAAEAVIWLSGGKWQCFLNQFNVEVQQYGTVKQEKVFFTALAVAGKLEAANSEIGVTLDLDWRL